MSTVEITILVAFSLSFILQMIYYWFFYGGLAFSKKRQVESTSKPPVSIVIAARNEYHHLVKNLEPILAQDYPDFEVVVVNHASDDESAEYLTEISKKDPKLKIVHIKEDLNFFSGKKFPLSLGIKTAANELLLLTDADCIPDSSNWLSKMVSSYAEETEIVLGYGPYEKKKGFTNMLVRYDTFIVAMQYLSYALRGLPYMGVGRNLSYKRSMFFRNKGFTSHYKIASGDDDLFINQAANKRNTNICIDRDSFMYSDPVSSLKEWFKQKQRHLTTGKKYKVKFKFLLGTYSVSLLIFYTLLVTMLILNIYPIVALALLACRVITQFIVHKKILRLFGENQILLFSLLWELLHMLIIQFITLTSLFRKTVQWK